MTSRLAVLADVHADVAALDDALARIEDLGCRGLLEKVDAEVLVVGHTHLPAVIHVGGTGLIVNPGALFCSSDVVTDRARARRLKPAERPVLDVSIQGRPS